MLNRSMDTTPHPESTCILNQKLLSLMNRKTISASKSAKLNCKTPPKCRKTGSLLLTTSKPKQTLSLPIILSMNIQSEFFAYTAGIFLLIKQMRVGECCQTRQSVFCIDRSRTGPASANLPALTGKSPHLKNSLSPTQTKKAPNNPSFYHTTLNIPFRIVIPLRNGMLYNVFNAHPKNSTCQSRILSHI